MKRFAVISDVHGNRWALHAVLEDIERAGISKIVNLGDMLYGPLDPAGTADLLMRRDLPTVRGNEDRIIVEENAQLSQTLRFVRGQLGDHHFHWLASLHPTLVVENAYLCHGTPDSDTNYLLWEVGPSGIRLRRSQDVALTLSSICESLILCGHDHVSRTMHLADGKVVVNPGSVGLPAYSDDHPHLHVMESGAPHARYALVLRTSQGWTIHDVAVPYDWQAAADQALQNGRADWAEWLQTGQASV